MDKREITPAELEILEIAKRVSETYPEGEKFFDHLDEELQNNASERVLNELFARVPPDNLVILSGGFGKKLAEGIDNGTYPKFSYILYKGGIRSGAEPEILKTRVFPTPISEVKAVFLDDSIYGGATYRKIQEHLKPSVPSMRCLVIYDGCPVVRGDISAIFRYYDHFEAKPNFTF